MSLEEIKVMLEQQVNSITTELHAKIDSAQKVETELRKERVKVKSFEADLHDHFSDSEETKFKLKESERKTQNLIKSLQYELDRKKEESIAKTSEVALLNTRVVEAEKKLKHRDVHIA